MEETPAPAAEAPRPELKKRAIGGATWVLATFGIQQILRFGSNWVLARILMPEAFGLMSLTQVFITGLELLSDAGIGPAIVQSKRGEDPKLLDTAWTLQIIRGLGLAACAAIVAWPAAAFYHQPLLFALIPVAGGGCAIRGFSTTRTHVLNRQIIMGRIMALDLGTQVISIGITILAAWHFRSVWGLLVGSLTGDFVRVTLGHILLPGPRPRFGWHPDAAKEIGRVGRWTLLSTATAFVVGNLDRLTLGRLLSPQELGVYSIALMMANTVQSVGRTIGSKILFPVLTETLREAPDRLYARFRKIRLAWALPTVAVFVVLAVWGDYLIRFLYKPVYWEAGWMLRLLAAGSVAAVINQCSGIVWPAMGEFKLITILMLIQIPILFGAMLLGHHLAGLRGLVAGVAVVEVFIYPVLSLFQRRLKVWQPEVDLPLFAGAGGLIALGFWLRGGL